MNRPYIERLPRIARLIAMSAAVAVGGFACDANQPLKVKDPDVAVPAAATGAAALPLLRAGTLADFAVAVVGAADQANNAHEGIANLGAAFTDEFTDEGTFPTRNSLNTRLATNTNSTIAGVFQNLGSVHNDAVRALAQYATFGPTQIGRAEMYNIDAYIYVYDAEHFCSGVPFSTIDVGTGKIVNGAFLTTAQMLDTAIAEFQLAKGVANSDTTAGDDIATQLGLATVGTARALLDLGQVAAAADTASTVAAGFSYQVFESTNSPRQENGIWNYTLQSPTLQEFSVADKKNGTGLPFVSDPDPRVPWDTAAAPANDGTFPFFAQQKYPAPNSNFTVADIIEAQLIVAEGDIFGGNYTAGLTILNQLRASFASPVPLPSFFPTSLAPLPSLAGGTPKAQIQQLLTERAYWMYVTGHRLGDWRRVLRAPYSGAPWNFVTADVYPVGGSIQNTLEFPTPQLTNPNPNYVACDATLP
jgi:starch-binding outer membrane protein, SusD/RagB family